MNRKERTKEMRKDPQVLEAMRKKDRERKKRQRVLNKIQKCIAFLKENGVTEL